jgi:hypothetical protein
MASSLDRTQESRPDFPRGHGTRDLGPSDSTDSGSDVVGGPGLGDLEPLDLDRGTTDDPGRSGSTAGPDVGDSDLDSDSDAGGTGENITAGRDPLRTNQDVMPDRIVEDLPQVEADDAAGAGADLDGGSIPDRAGDSTAASSEVPTIDNPPPLRRGADVPVADRHDDGEAASRDEGAPPLRGGTL